MLKDSDVLSFKCSPNRTIFIFYELLPIPLFFMNCKEINTVIESALVIPPLGKLIVIPALKLTVVGIKVFDEHTGNPRVTVVVKLGNAPVEFNAQVTLVG